MEELRWELNELRENFDICIGGNPLYESLDDGKGVCVYFNTETNLCEIYNNRPLICRVDDAYEIYFKER